MKHFCLLCLFVLGISCDRKHRETGSREYSGWEAYAGGPMGNRYSADDQIDLTNVHRLKRVWEFSSGDKDPRNRSQNQCNPIVVDAGLYGTSPKSKLLALDAARGEPLWIFDPAKEGDGPKMDAMAFYKVNRGVVYWEDAQRENKRIFYNVGAKVYAIAVETGKPIREFGQNGHI